MTISFWLLDINYEVRDDHLEIWLWGITEDDKRILLIDKSFKPYFYVVVGEDSPKTREEIISMLKETKGVESCEVKHMKRLRKEVEAIKVVCQTPLSVERCVKRLSKMRTSVEVFEHDLRPSAQYLIDRDVGPCGWYSAEVEEISLPENVRVDRAYQLLQPLKPVDRVDLPPIRALAFDVVAYDPYGSPKPETAKIVLISVATSDGGFAQFVCEGEDDREVIQQFVDYVLDFDPDILVGFESNRSVLPLLSERAERLGLKLTIDRIEGIPHTSVYGHVSVTGRINLDMRDFAEDFIEIKVKDLRNLAKFLGVKREVLSIPETEIPKLWERGEVEKLSAYSRSRAEALMDVFRSLAEYSTQLSHLIGMPLDYVVTSAVGFRVEWFLMRHAHRVGELIPSRAEVPYAPYKGAMVLQPKVGLHEKVAVLDFKSMYPNIMIMYNVSPDTYVPPDEDIPDEEVNIAPEVGHRFLKKPPGMYKAVLSSLLEARDSIRKSLKKVPADSPEYRVLDARQRVVKVLANATYGYAGWVGARWFVKPVAEAVAAWGRYVISETIKIAESLGLQVIYGDTDSVFVRYDEELVEKFCKAVEEKLGLEVRPETVYERLLFTEAKKRYAGLLPDGSLDIVGLEVVRGDWAEIAKKAQERVLEVVLKGRGREEAIKQLKELVSSIYSLEAPYEDFIIWKTLTMSIDQYKVRAPHVEVAKSLLKSGWKPTVGDKIGYVVVKGEGKLREKARFFGWASKEDLDLDYYVNHQVLPAATRVLSVLGVSEEELKRVVGEKEGPKTLMDFFQQRS